MPTVQNRSTGPIVRLAVASWGGQEFFGGLAVAAIVIHPRTATALEALQLQGWKGLGASAIAELSGKIERIAPSERLLIEAGRYNKACNGKGGLPSLMRWAFGTVSDSLLARFPECATLVFAIAEGESVPEPRLSRKDILIVAPGEGYVDPGLEAAGAIARWLYEDRRLRMAEKLGLSLEGDSRALGRELMRKHGEPILYEIAKMNLPEGRELLAGGGA